MGFSLISDAMILTLTSRAAEAKGSGSTNGMPSINHIMIVLRLENQSPSAGSGSRL